MQTNNITAPLPQEAPLIQRFAAGGSAFLRRRAAACMGMLWLAGAMPAIFRHGLGWDVPAGWEAFGWGLWFPGAGFIAVGGWWLIAVPIVWLVLQVAVFFWAISAMLIAPLIVWLGAAIWAGIVCSEDTFSYAIWVVPLLGVSTVAWKVFSEWRAQARESILGQQRNHELPALLDDLNQRADKAHDTDELDPDQLAAARYIFGLALQPVGQLEGFNRIDNFQSAAVRYQLNYISYALAALQFRYTPKFHSYLNQAQQFAIESLADPSVCGYWKWEYLWGRFGWNPDPVGTLDNIMLTGWSQVALTTYAANTGDLRYQEEGALLFKPIRHGKTCYAHNAHSFTRSIIDNWRHSITKLYACEPHWVFPLCNAYAYSGLLPYDRVNGTHHARDNHAALVHQLEADFLLPDGSVRAVLNTLTGWRWLSRGMPVQSSLILLLQLCRVSNAFHPGYARRWYLIAREKFLAIDTEGHLQLKELSWDELLDLGNYRKTPGYLLGVLALAAREHGDELMARAALNEADRRFTRVVRDGVLAYEGISTIANINLAAARMAGFRDWQNMIAYGINAEKISGPILAGCVYPNVLVAAAHGDKDSLELVLYPGGLPSSDPQILHIERLEPNSRYRIEGVEEAAIETSNQQTNTTLNVILKGRTELRLYRED